MADNANTRRYILEIDEEQATLVRNALEFYARIIIGQWNMIGELCLNLDDENYADKKEILDDGMYELRKIAYPDLTHHASYGVTKKEKACLAWEIYQVLRYRLAYTKYPKGGWAVDFRLPMSFSGKELAKCTIKENENTSHEDIKRSRKETYVKNLLNLDVEELADTVVGCDICPLKDSEVCMQADDCEKALIDYFSGY